MQKIRLNRKKFALVDDADFNWLNQWKWTAMKEERSWYAIRNDKGKLLLMHRLLFPDAKLVAHRDDNGLNNQRANLRPATSAQNLAARRFFGPKSSPFRGVSWYGPLKCWHAQIGHQYKCIHLGYHRTQEEAARAYDAGARKLKGSWARLNFPSLDKTSKPA